MSEATYGPCHIHWPGDDGFPDQAGDRLSSWPVGWEPAFLVEFGREGTDYGGYMVCGFRGYNDHGHTVETTARLHAAAPDLLAACKEAVDYYRRLPPHPDRGHDVVADLALLEAAIAKAEGSE